MNLRPYQKDCSDAILREWGDNNSTLIVVPTGGGKTIIIADVIRRMRPMRTMVLAHREELIWQARDKIQSWTGLNCGIEMAGLRAHGEYLFAKSDVIISTIQTQISGNGDGSRMSKFDPLEFGCLVIDEAHHATSKSYRDVIGYYQQNPDLRLLGVTATPDRADEAALGQVFKTVAYDYEILDAIHDGWLVPVEQQMVNIAGLDFSHVRTTAGDLNGSDLAAVMENESNMQGVCGASRDIIGNRRAIVFTVSVKQAEQGCEIMNRYRENCAAWVCGKTNKDERKAMLADFAAGKIQVVFNCGVLTEGFDDAGVEVIIMARPTKSRSLYAQMAGRSTRPLPGLVDGLATPEARKAAIANSAKSACLIVDFVGNSGRHKLMTSADILGGKVSEEALAVAVERAKKSGKAVRMADELDLAQGEIDKQREQRKQEAEARRKRLTAKVDFSATNINPFDEFDIVPNKVRGWDTRRTLSEPQRKCLSGWGIDPGKYPYCQAVQLIGEICKRNAVMPASEPQKKVLRRYGYPLDITKKEASKIIDALAKNGWRRPPENPPKQEAA